MNWDNKLEVNPNLATTTEGQSVNALIDSILQEKFSKETSLSELTVDQVLEVFEAAKDEFETEDLTKRAGDFAEAYESYVRCKEGFCSLLLLFDAQGFYPGYDETLSDLRTRTQLTQVTARPLVAAVEEVIKLESVPAPIAHILEADDQISLTAEMPLPFEPPIEPSFNQGEKKPHLVLARNENPLPPSETTWIAETHPIWNADVPLDPEPPYGAKGGEAVTSSSGAGGSAPEPQEEWVVAHSISDEPPPVEKTEWEAPIQPVAAAEHWEDPNANPQWMQSAPAPVWEPGGTQSSLPANHQPNEYWKLIEFFTSLKGKSSFPLAEVHLTRLIAQTYSLAVEFDVTEKLMPAVSTFWASREAAIRSLLDTNQRLIGLRAGVERGLVESSTLYAEWILNNTLSASSVLETLKHTLATQELSDLKPSLADMGFFILLFGQNANLHGVPLHNELGIQGLNPTETWELVCRLVSLQALSEKARGAVPFSDLDLDLVSAATKRIKNLLSKSKLSGWDNTAA